MINLYLQIHYYTKSYLDTHFVHDLLKTEKKTNYDGYQSCTSHISYVY